MSRPDPHDTEYPPGLGRYPNRSQERDKILSFAQTGAGAPAQQYRHPSTAPPTSYVAFGNKMSRSLGSHYDSRDYAYGLPELAGPNRHNPSSSIAHGTGPAPFSSFNHHHRPSPPPQPANTQPPPAATFLSSSPSDHDSVFLRQPQATNALHNANNQATRSTLWWGELEPWMEEDYAKQVCNLMKWDPITVKVPHPPPDPATGQQVNNPGYCFLTFPTPGQAASVLAQISAGGNGGKNLTMPNSSKPFVMNWASSMTSASPMSTTFPAASNAQAAPPQQYPKEYSIFVGDLAPETSNSDLVAVFRNPVLGLRNDREPKFIRPFLSCKSAKIMLDPLTGVSRGYGFVRFTDEGDQQRALIEMHGLYCLSRPMRISPATAKFKPPTTLPSFDLPQVQFTTPPAGGFEQTSQPVTIALPLPNPAQTKSVSAPIAATVSNGSLGSGASSLGGSNSNNSLSSGTASSASIASVTFGPDETSNALLAQLTHQQSPHDPSSLKPPGIYQPYTYDDQVRQMLQQQNGDPSSRYVISEESWKHHAQARAILGNLIGPNGEQLTSTDPYNTTVFVGGLSPLISEETLRTFFAPFGDIHYVKVPVGKHCGFVQFVRKADAEKAIEKMQGFSIGGSKIRLSWGRSQYKAAQAAAQAAQAAAMQPQYVNTAPPAPNALTPEQAMQMWQRLNMPQYFSGMHNASGSHVNSELEQSLLHSTYSSGRTEAAMPLEDGQAGLASYGTRPEIHRPQSNFAPFSPDPNHIYVSSGDVRRESTPFGSRMEALSHPSKYGPGFFSMSQDLKVNTGVGQPAKTSPTPSSAHSANAPRYSFAESSDPATPLNRAPGRAEAPISRPSSGQMSIHSRGGQDADPIHDLNGTLASLDLDRPWKASDVAGTRSG